MKRGLTLLVITSGTMLGVSGAAMAADGAPPRDPHGAMMKMFDADGDGKVTREEAATKRAELFAQADTNGDRQISYDEARAFMKSMVANMPEPPEMGPPGDGNEPPPPPPGGEGSQDNAAEQPDAPGVMAEAPNGAMPGTRGQHMNGHDRGHHGRDGHMRFGPRTRAAIKFVQVDANDNGFISEDELNFVMERAFSMMDRNADDVIDARDMHRHRHGGNGPRG